VAVAKDGARSAWPRAGAERGGLDSKTGQELTTGDRRAPAAAAAAAAATAAAAGALGGGLGNERAHSFNDYNKNNKNERQLLLLQSHIHGLTGHMRQVSRDNAQAMGDRSGTLPGAAPGAAAAGAAAAAGTKPLGEPIAWP